MIDVNLLLYATNPAEPRHDAARQWFEDQMNSGDRVGLPWHTLLGFLRNSTGPARQPSLDLNEALEFMEGWLEWDTVWVPEPTSEHHVVLARLLRKAPKVRLISDAHLAALAIEHGLTLCSADVDFRVFEGLKLFNPLDP